MKLIIIMLVMSSILFSWQKQIILGCYSVENNGKRALSIIDKQIADDIQLQAFMEDYSLRTINTEISGYTVVSINAFESYTSLLNTMSALKVYYGDAYVLKYPTKNIAAMEMLAKIEKKAAEEKELLEKEDEVKRIELKKLLQEEALNAEVAEMAVEEPIVEEVFFEDIVSEPEIEVVEKTIEVVEEKPDYIMYLVFFAILGLLAAGIVVFKITGNKSKPLKKDD